MVKFWKQLSPWIRAPFSMLIWRRVDKRLERDYSIAVRRYVGLTSNPSLPAEKTPEMVDALTGMQAAKYTLDFHRRNRP